MENKIFTVEELNEKGLNELSPTSEILKVIDVKNESVVIEGKLLLTIITKDGEKVFYDKTKLPSLTPELLKNIMANGDSAKKVDDIIDNHLGEQNEVISAQNTIDSDHPIEKSAKQLKIQENQIINSADLGELTIKSPGPEILKKIFPFPTNQGVVIDDSNFWVIVTQNGQKAIYPKSKVPTFSTELLITLANQETIREIDDLVDNYFNKDFFCICENEIGQIDNPLAHGAFNIFRRASINFFLAAIVIFV